METEQKIQLIPKEAYKLSNKELRRFYVVLSLLRYRRERFPNYDEKFVLRRLKKDLKSYVLGMQLLMEQDPNNHFLHRLQSFHDTLYNYFKEEIEQPDQIPK